VKPTIYDVAEKAGVSIATVSKVINQTGRISEKTINKVNQVMDELDYQPSSVAADWGTCPRYLKLLFCRSSKSF
jgi:DNA-binding LacI/PurR family transcriptional regulator